MVDHVSYLRQRFRRRTILIVAQATLTSTSWMPAPDGATLASPLPDGGQGAQRPRSRGGEEPEVTGGRRDDLRGELVSGVQQAHERAADRLTRAVDDAAGDHRLLLEVDAGRATSVLASVQSTYQLPNSIGTPTREPYSVQLPS